MSEQEKNINKEAMEATIKRLATIAALVPIGVAAAIKALDECVDLIETDAGRALQEFINKANGE